MYQILTNLKIFSNQLNIWSEPNERGEIKFILHKGTKVNLLENLEEWKKIRPKNDLFSNISSFASD